MTTTRTPHPRLSEPERVRLAQSRRAYRIARAKHGHTVHDAAAYLGVSRQQVDDVLNGRNVSARLTLAIARYCRTAPPITPKRSPTDA